MYIYVHGFKKCMLYILYMYTVLIHVYYTFIHWVSLVAQWVRNLPAIQETRVQSLGWEDPLEKEMATHSSILAWRSPWTEELDRLQSMGLQELDRT